MREFLIYIAIILQAIGLSVALDPVEIQHSGALHQVKSGTAWSFNTDGYVATAYHVVSGSKTFVVIINGDEKVRAVLVATDKVNDVAILKIDRNLPYFLPLQPTYIDREVAIEWGYPIPDQYGLDLKYSKGYLTKNVQGIYRFEGASCPGNSGGPVIGTYGVVGLVSVGVSPFEKNMCGRISMGPSATNVIKLAEANNLKYYIGNGMFNPYPSNKTVFLIYAW